jgi:hypothetical protein
MEDYLADHIVLSHCVVPAAAFVEFILGFFVEN